MQATRLYPKNTFHDDAWSKLKYFGLLNNKKASLKEFSKSRFLFDLAMLCYISFILAVRDTVEPMGIDVSFIQKARNNKKLGFNNDKILRQHIMSFIIDHRPYFMAGVRSIGVFINNHKVELRFFVCVLNKLI